MKITAVDKTEGPKNLFSVKFEDDCWTITKLFECTVGDAVSQTLSLLRAIKEAERDRAFDMFGERWREHVTPGFWTRVYPIHAALMKQADALCPNTFNLPDGSDD